MKARLSQYVVEVLIPSAAKSPTTPTGAGISQYVIEALVDIPPAYAVLSQYVVEVLMSQGETQTDPPGPAGPGVRVFGYAG